MHASLSLWQDLKILSTEEREEVEAMRNGDMTSGKKPAVATPDLRTRFPREGVGFMSGLVIVFVSETFCSVVV